MLPKPFCKVSTFFPAGGFICESVVRFDVKDNPFDRVVASRRFCCLEFRSLHGVLIRMTFLRSGQSSCGVSITCCWAGFVVILCFIVFEWLGVMDSELACGSIFILFSKFGDSLFELACRFSSRNQCWQHLATILFIKYFAMNLLAVCIGSNQIDVRFVRSGHILRP